MLRLTRASVFKGKIQYTSVIVWLILNYVSARVNPTVNSVGTSEDDRDLNINDFTSMKAVDVVETKLNKGYSRKITTVNSVYEGLNFDDLFGIRKEAGVASNSDSLNEKEKVRLGKSSLAKTEDGALEITYDYDQFKKEYDSIVELTESGVGQLNKTEFKPSSKSQCDANKFFNKGPFTIACLLIEYFETNETEIRKNAGASLVRLIKLWLLGTTLFLLIGWAHYGYLNVCCPFTACFPDDGYDEIKRQLVLNPPGTRTEIKTTTQDKGSRMKLLKLNYKPYEPEYYFYNMLWNKIYRQ